MITQLNKSSHFIITSSLKNADHNIYIHTHTHTHTHMQNESKTLK